MSGQNSQISKCFNVTKLISNDSFTILSPKNINFDINSIDKFLINDLTFDDYIQKHLFNKSISHISDQDSFRANLPFGQGTRIDLTNSGNYKLDQIEISEIKTTSCFETNDDINYYEPPIIIKSTINSIKLYSSNIYINNKKLEDHIYDIVNSYGNVPSQITGYVHVPNTGTIDVSNLGNYYTNTINTSKIDTTELLNSEVTISSDSYIHLDSPNVFINDDSLNKIIEQSLDETNLFELHFEYIRTVSTIYFKLNTSHETRGLSNLYVDTSDIGLWSYNMRIDVVNNNTQQDILINNIITYHGIRCKELHSLGENILQFPASQNSNYKLHAFITNASLENNTREYTYIPNIIMTPLKPLNTTNITFTQHDEFSFTIYWFGHENSDDSLDNVSFPKIKIDGIEYVYITIENTTTQDFSTQFNLLESSNNRFEYYKKNNQINLINNHNHNIEVASQVSGLNSHEYYIFYSNIVHFMPIYSKPDAFDLIYNSFTNDEDTNIISFQFYFDPHRTLVEAGDCSVLYYNISKDGILDKKLIYFIPETQIANNTTYQNLVNSDGIDVTEETYSYSLNLSFINNTVIRLQVHTSNLYIDSDVFTYDISMSTKDNIISSVDFTSETSASVTLISPPTFQSYIIGYYTTTTPSISYKKYVSTSINSLDDISEEDASSVELYLFNTLGTINIVKSTYVFPPSLTYISIHNEYTSFKTKIKIKQFPGKTVNTIGYILDIKYRVDVYYDRKIHVFITSPPYSTDDNLIVEFYSDVNFVNKITDGLDSLNGDVYVSFIYKFDKESLLDFDREYTYKIDINYSYIESGSRITTTSSVVFETSYALSINWVDGAAWNSDFTIFTGDVSLILSDSLTSSSVSYDFIPNDTTLYHKLDFIELYFILNNPNEQVNVESLIPNERLLFETINTTREYTYTHLTDSSASPIIKFIVSCKNVNSTKIVVYIPDNTSENYKNSIFNKTSQHSFEPPDDRWVNYNIFSSIKYLTYSTGSLTLTVHDYGEIKEYANRITEIEYNNCEEISSYVDTIIHDKYHYKPEFIFKYGSPTAWVSKSRMIPDEYIRPDLFTWKQDLLWTASHYQDPPINNTGYGGHTNFKHSGWIAKRTTAESASAKFKLHMEHQAKIICFDFYNFNYKISKKANYDKVVDPTSGLTVRDMLYQHAKDEWADYTTNNPGNIAYYDDWLMIPNIYHFQAFETWNIKYNRFEFMNPNRSTTNDELGYYDDFHVDNIDGLTISTSNEYTGEEIIYNEDGLFNQDHVEIVVDVNQDVISQYLIIEMRAHSSTDSNEYFGMNKLFPYAIKTNNLYNTLSS